MNSDSYVALQVIYIFKCFNDQCFNVFVDQASCTLLIPKEREQQTAALFIMMNPLVIVRILEVTINCISFSLVASVGQRDSPFWIWCMFTWGFCFIVPLIVLLVEFTKISEKLPFNWQGFTVFYSTLATFMVGAFFILYCI